MVSGLQITIQSTITNRSAKPIAGTVAQTDQGVESNLQVSSVVAALQQQCCKCFTTATSSCWKTMPSCNEAVTSIYLPIEHSDLLKNTSTGQQSYHNEVGQAYIQLLKALSGITTYHSCQCCRELQALRPAVITPKKRFNTSFKPMTCWWLLVTLPLQHLFRSWQLHPSNSILTSSDSSYAAARFELQQSTV